MDSLGDQTALAQVQGVTLCHLAGPLRFCLIHIRSPAEKSHFLVSFTEKGPRLRSPSNFPDATVCDQTVHN